MKWDHEKHLRGYVYRVDNVRHISGYFFLSKKFIMAKIFQPSDKIKLIFILFYLWTCMKTARPKYPMDVVKHFWFNVIVVMISVTDLFWIYNYLCNPCLSLLALWVRSHLRKVYSIQHYVIQFVSDLRQVGGFLRVQIKLTATILLKYCWKWR